MKGFDIREMKTNFCYTAHDITPFFLKKGVSPLKLQKLLYYAQVWHIVKNRNSLFTDDIEAWMYGPVVPSIWHRFRFVRKNDTINVGQADHFYPQQTALKGDIIDHLNEVWNSYGHLSGIELVDLTHREKPWTISRGELKTSASSKNKVILDSNTLSNYQLDFFGNIPYVKSQRTLGHYQS